MVNTDPYQSPASQPGSGRKTVIVISILVVIGFSAIAAFGWYIYTVSSSDSPNSSGQPVVADDGVVNENSSPVPPAQLPDADRDGLSDADEARYNTQSNTVDTDNDGLTDRQEIDEFKTDPTNEDTDGDGFFDGLEVRNGFNPNGSGELILGQ